MGGPNTACHQSPASRRKHIAVGRGENRGSQASKTTEKDNSSLERKKREGGMGEKETKTGTRNKSNISKRLSPVIVLGYGKEESRR